MVDKEKLTVQLRKLKKQIQEDPQVRALYDLNNDGQISGEEWDKARKAVIRFMEIQEKKAAAEETDGDNKARDIAGAAGVAVAGAAGAADYVYRKLKGKADKKSGASEGPVTGSLLELSEIIVQQQVEGLELIANPEYTRPPV